MFNLLIARRIGIIAARWRAIVRTGCGCSDSCCANGCPANDCAAIKGSTTHVTDAANTNSTKADTANLFTLPNDQIAHLQITPVAKGSLPRVLRLTGTVAYNAFTTTPVF